MSYDSVVGWPVLRLPLVRRAGGSIISMWAHVRPVTAARAKSRMLLIYIVL